MQVDEGMSSLYSEFGEDPELAYALKLSMMEEEAASLKVPDEPADTDDQATVVTV